jgi:hypothetical protein
MQAGVFYQQTAPNQSFATFFAPKVEDSCPIYPVYVKPDNSPSTIGDTCKFRPATKPRQADLLIYTAKIHRPADRSDADHELCWN